MNSPILLTRLRESSYVKSQLPNLRVSLLNPTVASVKTAHPPTHGTNNAVPVIAAAWYHAPRTLNGTGGMIHGAQLPGR